MQTTYEYDDEMLSVDLELEGFNVSSTFGSASFIARTADKARRIMATLRYLDGSTPLASELPRPIMPTVWHIEELAA